MSFAWTEERVERAKSLASDGFCGSSIAADLGTTKNAVMGKLWRLGVRLDGTRHAIPIEQVRQARQLLASGLSLKEAAARLGVLSSDLDQSLWVWFSEPDYHAQKYSPDF